MVFWKNLHKNFLKNNMSSPFATSSTADCDLWKQCWTAAATGANGTDFPAMSLLQVYVALPDAESIHPSAFSVLQVLGAIVRGVDTSRMAANTVKAVDTVVSIVKTRIQSSGSLATIRGDVEKLKSLAKDLEKCLQKSVLALRMHDFESEPLKHLMRDIEGPVFPSYLRSIERAAEDNAHVAVVEDGPVWTTWRTQPTVGWLMSGAWHQDVPALREVYPDGLKDYAETLLRTWTVLTFYWGSAALWPRCKDKSKRNGDDCYCDEPMLCHVAHNRNIMCCTVVRRNGVVSSCDQVASWACHKHIRHQAVCQRCLAKQQLVLGGPGPEHNRPTPTGASTDIYNAVVSREESRSVGTVFHLTGVTSRKPPNVPPNWRTSYRLQPSALVAVVKLSVSNESLTPEHTLHWAEIVQSTPPGRAGKGGPAPPQESTFRQQSRMAVRLLGRGDIATFTNEPDLPLNTQIAVIDLRVFVPEVISVLATFANPRFGEHLEQIPFARRLIGTGPSPPLLRLFGQEATIREYTVRSIMGSEIRSLVMLSEDAKRGIIDKILRLPPVLNLYGTQLEAFANGLSSALHCTQGPPGTGKVSACDIFGLYLSQLKSLIFFRRVTLACASFWLW